MIGFILGIIMIFVAIGCEINAGTCLKNHKRNKAIARLSWIALLFCWFMVIYGGIKADYVETNTHNVIALEDNRGVNGRIRRYYGRITSTQDITLAVGSNSHYVIWNLNAASCQIYEGDYEQPYIVCYQMRAWDSSVFEPVFGVGYVHYRYDIYIPSGTLQTDFNIDLK